LIAWIIMALAFTGGVLCGVLLSFGLVMDTIRRTRSRASVDISEVLQPHRIEKGGAGR
jgi:hypothetical protein